MTCLEKGEQNSAYFFRLEKFHSKNNSINRLNINGAITDNSKLVSKFCSTFYSKLYCSKYNEEAATLFLNSIKDLKKLALITELTVIPLLV